MYREYIQEEVRLSQLEFSLGLWFCLTCGGRGQGE